VNTVSFHVMKAYMA